MTFFSSVLGAVQHPINIMPEYFDAFGSKPKAAILTWLDTWGNSGKEWVWLVLEELAQKLKWCRDTLHRHIRELLKLGVIERKRANRWPTDQAYQYRLNHEELKRHVSIQTDDSKKSDSGESENLTSTVGNSEIFLNQFSNQSSNHTNNVSARADFFEEVNQEELIDLGVKVEEVEQCVNKNAENYDSAVEALSQAVKEDRCENPTGFLLSALRNGWGKYSTTPRNNSLSSKIPQPSTEQLRSLRLIFGTEEVYEGTIYDANLGYPLAWFVKVQGFELPWWKVWEKLEASNEEEVIHG